MKCFFCYSPPEEVAEGCCDLMSINLENYIRSDRNLPQTTRVCEHIDNPNTANGAKSFHK